jgi:toxin ParE1/3/4
MSYNLSLSSLAKNDLVAITEYTIQQWGEAQADKYLEQLENGLSKVQNNPNIGRIRTDISDRHRSILVEKHIIIYFVQDNKIFVSRILHQSRDVSSIFG